MEVIWHNRKMFEAEQRQADRSTDRRKQAEQEQQKPKRRESDSKFIRLYEDLSKKLISEEQFRMLSAHFEQEKRDYTEEIEKLNTMAENLEDSACKAEQLANEMAECAEIKELTTAIVNRLIEKIEVSEPTAADGEKVQKIRIFYKFVGEIN